MVEYKEIFRLKEMLEKSHIPFEFIDRICGQRKGYQIRYLYDGECICSVIEHFGSYGNEDDLLEIMGLLTDKEKEIDSVKGWLTAENVFERIKKHYCGSKMVKDGEQMFQAYIQVLKEQQEKEKGD